LHVGNEALVTIEYRESEKGASAQVQVLVRESSQVADVRRKTTMLAGQAGFSETKAGICAVIASEMGTNLVKHATEGEIFLRTVAQGSVQGIELLALDRGPGMASVGRSLQDGHSTAGSSGNGLGAIVRMASEFDIHSLPGRGTGLVARVWNRDLPGIRDVSTPVTGVINLAKPGESVSGDAWLSISSNRRTLCAVVDGLGHGPLAAQASALAIESLREHRGASLAEQIDFAHGALRATRGAALGVAEILHDQKLIKFVGIGNIMAAVHQDGTVRNMVSQNGILGHQIRRVTEFQYPWSESALLVMCSDGINTHWDLSLYAGLTTRDPSLIAATLYRDFTRGRDDTTVIVLKTPVAVSGTNS
jgi:anti-sigma regulatory factor (Ser/Thr protein kinase)